MHDPEESPSGPPFSDSSRSLAQAWEWVAVAMREWHTSRPLILYSWGIMANGWGGRRPGAGRKPGSTTKKTAMIAQQARDAGISPLEVMLSTMRRLWQPARSIVSSV